MKRRFLMIFLALPLLLSCHGNADESSRKKNKVFEMYDMSEMAALMERMYADHRSMRARILKDAPIGKFPEHLYGIRSAKMTDPEDNDALFRENAENYLAAEKALFEHRDRAHFNQAVDACMTCHGQKCGGPVPRIKKLYLP